MKKILEFKAGSHLYGTNTENSDLDLKGIYLPSKEAILLGKIKEVVEIKRPKAPGEKNNKDDIDIVYYSLDRFLGLVAEGQTVALDMLFANESDITFQTEEGKALFDLLKLAIPYLISKKTNAFVGYAMRQAAKYGIKGSRVATVRKVVEYLKTLPQDIRLKDAQLEVLIIDLEHATIDYKMDSNNEICYLNVCDRKFPMTAKVGLALKTYEKILEQYGQRALKAESNQGVDWKALHHAVRVNNQAIELLKTGKITFPRPEADLLLKIKKGEIAYDDVSVMIEEGLSAIEKESEISRLPSKPNQIFIEGIILDFYEKIVKGEI